MDITDALISLRILGPPEGAMQMLRLSLLDWSACGIAGAKEPGFSAFVDLHRGGVGSGIFGGGQSGPNGAALVNGTLSHALDYDDTHLGHIGHPSVAVLPAVLALAQTQGAPLDEIVQAATIGIEASIQVGLWLGRTHYQIGFHQTATAGAFGATLGCSRLLRLDDMQTRMALGLCASMASGLKAQFGTMAKPLNAGLAARTGVEAAQWAQAGITAADDGLAGPLGFAATHHAEENPVQPGQEPWQIETISHKFHACCHGLHATLEAISGLRFAPGDVHGIDIRTHPRWMSVCNIAAPRSGLEAKFSYGQVTAMSLLGHDTAAIGSFTDVGASNPQITEMRRKVRVAEDHRLDETTAEVILVLSNGDVRTLRHDLMAPMSMAARTGRLRAKAAALLGQERGDMLWDAVQGDSLHALSDQLFRS